MRRGVRRNGHVLSNDKLCYGRRRRGLDLDAPGGPQADLRERVSPTGDINSDRAVTYKWTSITCSRTAASRPTPLSGPPSDKVLRVPAPRATGCRSWSPPSTRSREDKLVGLVAAR